MSPPLAGTEPDPGPAPTTPRKLTVLVVDDEPLVRCAISLLLRTNGFSVVEADHGATALERVWVARPDLILSDLNMGPVDGLDLLRALRRDPELQAIPFLLLTAEVHSARFAAAMREGADGHVGKPFTASDLLEAIRSRLPGPL